RGAAPDGGDPARRLAVDQGDRHRPGRGGGAGGGGVGRHAAGAGGAGGADRGVGRSMRVALGVSGGLAAYKACEDVRGLASAGAEVHVLMTANAQRFITPLTLQALSARKVLTDPWDLSDDETIRHIELSRGLDALVVAPATANALAKFASGVADDVLSTFY